MSESYFFDTYAIIEILKGNPTYAKFKHSKVIITIFNLAELHYKLIRDFTKTLADEILNEYSDYAIHIDNEIIMEANEFKLRHRKKKLSAADAIGYATAQKYGLRFLTGDRHFKKLRGVEWVK